MNHKKIRIILEGGLFFDFKGTYRRDLEKPNWHYYEDEHGNINHFRKEKMIAVIEGDPMVPPFQEQAVK